MPAARVGLGRTGVSLLLIVLAVVGVTGSVDRFAEQTAEQLFAKAVATYAMARTLNGVISVAQGTEIAVQPVGVGLTISAGQILDPLNDLVERFSWLVLAACASLGVQLLITEMFSSAWLNLALVGITGLALIALWWPQLRGRTLILKFCTAFLFTRFVFVVVTLLGALLNNAFLLERQETAMASVGGVSEALEQDQQASGNSLDDTADDSVEPSLLNRVNDFLSGQRQKFDVETRLKALQEKAESATAALINLIIVFLMQTVVLPLGLLYAAFAAFRLCWRNWPSGPNH